MSTAIAISNLVQLADTGDATSYATASYTPTANLLIIAVVVNTKGTTPDTPTLSGNGLTWVQVATVTFDSIAAPTARLTLFRAMGAAPSAGALTADFAGATQTSGQIYVSEFSNINTGGTNGSAAVVQSATNRSDSIAAGAYLTVALGSFADPANATFAVYCMTPNTTMAAGQNFTQQWYNGVATPGINTMTENASGGGNLTTAFEQNADGSAHPMAGIAIEIANVPDPTAGGGAQLMLQGIGVQ